MIAVQQRLAAETTGGCYEHLEHSDWTEIPRGSRVVEDFPAQATIPEDSIGNERAEGSTHTAIGLTGNGVVPERGIKLTPLTLSSKSREFSSKVFDAQQPTGQTVAVISSNRVEYAEIVLALWASGFKVALLSKMYTQSLYRELTQLIVI